MPRFFTLLTVLAVAFPLLAACGDRRSPGGDGDADADSDADGDGDAEGPDLDGDGTADWQCPVDSAGWDGQSCGYPAPPQDVGDVARDGIARINWWRSLVGLDPVTERADLSRGCQLHLEFLMLNGVFGHGEDPTMPGYTEEGAAAGLASELAYQGGNVDDYTMGNAVDGWVRTLYHRLRSFNPRLSEVGVAIEQSESTAMACLNDSTGIGQGGTMVSPTPVPAPGQTGVDSFFEGRESPCPTRMVNSDGGQVCAGAGTIVTLQFWQGEVLSQPGGSLQDQDGELVPGIVHYAGAPGVPNQNFLGNVIAFVPTDPLEIETEYTMTVVVGVNGAPKRYEWSFVTGSNVPRFPLPL
jgi:hypothetical protein